MSNITVGITIEDAKKILGNVSNVKSYLNKLSQTKDIEIPKGVTARELFGMVADTWDYELSKDIIRELFKATTKYKRGRESNAVLEVLVREWQEMGLGKISWPFSQGAFDNFVQSINSETIDREDKDKKVKVAAVKYRRIKEINTLRNDYIETLVFEKNINVVPTLNHSREVDFYINGIPYDQKVAKSPTNEFIHTFGDEWREHAIQHPDEVAKYLYEYQDEGRFGKDPRLYVVYLDQDISMPRVKQIVDNVDLDNPLSINFTYKHKANGEASYSVNCFVILLHN